MPFLLILLLFSHSARASSFESCAYKLKIKRITPSKTGNQDIPVTDKSQTDFTVDVEVLEYIGYDGMMGKYEGTSHKKTVKELCSGQIKTAIHAREIITGRELIKTGSVLRAKWSYYSAMGPDGAVGGKGWHFSVSGNSGENTSPPPYFQNSEGQSRFVNPGFSCSLR